MNSSHRIFVILVLLVLLIVGPVLFGGYVDEQAAQSLLEKQPLEASLRYESAVRRLPWRVDLYEQIGLAALQGRDTARAVTFLTLAQKKKSLSVAGQLSLGDVYWQTGFADKALAEWQAIDNGGQATGKVYSRLSTVYHFRAAFDAERQVIQKWLILDPENADAQYRLSLLFFADASPDALPLLEQVALTNPALKSHVEGLVSSLNSALEKSSQAERLTLCGQTLAAIGEWTLAEQAFTRAVNADPQDALAWAWFAEARQQTGKDNALDALQKAAALSPDLADVHGMFGLYWQRHSDWQKALTEFQAAARLEPKNPAWQMSLGGLYVHLGNLITALEYYQHAVDLAPRDSQTWRALALFSVENEASLDDVGRNAALQAYALEPANPKNMDVLGRVLTAAGEVDSAAAMLQKAVKAAPNDPAPAFHLGLLYLQTNQLGLAEKYLQSAQALDPNGLIGVQVAKILQRYFP